jgi:hypothetical protein
MTNEAHQFMFSFSYRRMEDKRREREERLRERWRRD